MKKLLLLLIAAFTSVTVLASAPVISFTVGGATCNGSRNGSITINSVNGCSGGPFTLMLDGNPIVLGQLVQNLAAGPHTLTVSDSNIACTFSEQIFVPEPGPISIEFAVTSATCKGALNGSITLQGVSGGTPPFTSITLDGTPFAIGETRSNQRGGAHTINIINGACLFSQQIFVPEPDPMSVVFDVTDVTCFGGNNGSITIRSIGGGTPPYTLLLDGDPITLGDPITNRRAGAHTLIVTDSTGTCMFSQQIFVGEPGTMQVQFDTTPATCFGMNNGTITVNGVTGGTPPYTLLLDEEPITLRQQVMNQRAGAHTLIVTDSTGTCKFTQQIFVGEPDPVRVAFDVTTMTAACPVGAVASCTTTGTITITSVTGGTPPYTSITLDGLPVTIGTPIMNLAGGPHTLVVTDSHNCLFSQQIFISESEEIGISFMVTPARCSNSSDGTITITNVNGATPPFTIVLDGNVVQLNNPVRGLQAGVHTVTVTANGCTFTQQITVPSPLPIQGNFAVTNASCNGTRTGSITLVSATGGTPGVAPAPAYTYTVDGGPETAIGTAIAGLAAGPHTIVIEDSVDCTSVSQQVFVGEPDIFQTTFTVKPATCHNGSNGSITVTKITGGTPFNDPAEPYELTLDGKVLLFNTESDPLTFGPHILTIRDLNGCTSSQQITVPNPGEFALEFTVKKVTCHGGNDGAITVKSVSGGTMSPTATCASSFSVCIDNLPCVAPGTEVGNLMAGPHTVTIVDANGCKFTQQIIVPEPDEIDFGFTVTPTTCNGVATGTITVTSASGGTPGTGAIDNPTYTYTVDGGAITNLGATVPALKPGAHTVVVTDSLGCKTTRQIFVPEPDPFQITFTTTDVTCNAGSDGSFTLTGVRGGTPGTAPTFKFTIDDSPVANIGQTITGLDAGAHTLLVTDGNGCQQSWQIFIRQPENTRITNVTTTHATVGQKNGSITIGAESNSSLLYSITGIDGSFQERSLFRCVAPGIYDLAVKATAGCEGSCALGCAVVGTAQPLVLTATTTNCSITATATGGTAPFEFALNNGAFCSPDEGSCLNPCTDSNTFTFNGLTDGCTYTVKVRDADGHVTCLDVEIPAITNGVERLIVRKQCCNVCGVCSTTSKCGSASCNTASCPGGVCPR